MKLYRLETPVQAGGDLITLPDPKHRIMGLFIRDQCDDQWLQFTRPNARAQPQIQLPDVKKADYLKATIGVPLFSAKARAVLTTAIPGELRFHECTVECQGAELPFYLARTLLYLPLVDREKSQFRTLSGGERLLMRAVYRSDFDRDFAIARDTEFRERLIVSQHFVDLSQHESLNIQFSDPL